MTIIAAVDNTDDAERIIKEAAYLATNLNEELQVVHVKDYSEIKESAGGETNRLNDPSVSRLRTSLHALDP